MSEYKVAKIIDNHTLVITAGKNQKIKSGQTFHIIGKSGVEVLDPDTHKKIGTLDEFKGEVIARIVYPNMTVAKTQSHSTLTQSTVSILNGGLNATQYEKLNVDPAQITGGFNPGDASPIQIGDLAVTDDEI